MGFFTSKQLTILIPPLVIAFFAPNALMAASFIINNGSTVTGTRVLGTNDTGAIDLGGILTITNGPSGILATGVNNIIINNGLIATAYQFGDGINSNADNLTVTNNGTIRIASNIASGINARNGYATITNTGSIIGQGNQGNGITSSGINVTIVNSGTITQAGMSLNAIKSIAANASITNSGSITTANNYASGIYSLGADATINNSGTLSATGANSYAILGGNNDITLNLYPGSNITGRIDLGGAGNDNDTVNIYGGNLSASFNFENTENINLLTAGVVNGNNVVTIDATGESTREVALSQWTSSVHHLIRQRVNTQAPLKPVQVAALALSKGMYFEERKPFAWLDYFGGKLDRDADGNALAYETIHSGVNFGYEWDLDTARVGLIGGIVQAKTNTNISSFKIQSDSYYVGGYGHFKLGRANVTTSVIGGYSESDNERSVTDAVNGLEKARSNVESFFISPSLTVGANFQAAETVEIRPSVTASYSKAWINDYKEKGTTSTNLKVDNRTIDILTARAQLAAMWQFHESADIELRGGIRSRHGYSDDIDACLDSNNFSYANAGDQHVTGRFVGLSLRVKPAEKLSIVAEVELGDGSDEYYLNGGLSLNYVF